MKLIVHVLIAACVLSASGCTATRLVSASKARLNQTARAIVGTSLVGARGATATDQDKIDDAVAGLCGAKAYTERECAMHDALN